MFPQGFRGLCRCSGKQICKDLHKLWAQGTSQVPFAVTACLALDGMQTYSHTAAVQVFMQLQTRSTAVSHCEPRVLLHNQNIWPLNWSKNFFLLLQSCLQFHAKSQNSAFQATRSNTIEICFIPRLKKVQRTRLQKQSVGNRLEWGLRKRPSH